MYMPNAPTPGLLTPSPAPFFLFDFVISCSQSTD